MAAHTGVEMVFLAVVEMASTEEVAAACEGFEVVVHMVAEAGSIVKVGGQTVVGVAGCLMVEVTNRWMVEVSIVQVVDRRSKEVDEDTPTSKHCRGMGCFPPAPTLPLTKTWSPDEPFSPHFMKKKMCFPSEHQRGSSRFFIAAAGGVRVLRLHVEGSRHWVHCLVCTWVCRWSRC